MSVLVTGARGLVGDRVATACEQTGLEVIRSGRSGGGRGWLAWDMQGVALEYGGRIDRVLHTAPIWLLPGHVGYLARIGTTRIVCFSSTSLATKRTSANRKEREVAARLESAEARLWDESARFEVATTILRPTMIYGYGRDGNVSTIAAFIRRFGFFAVAGRASGKRQPVHADDLCTAAITALDREETHGRTYDVGGGEILAYRAMIERIFTSLNKPVRIVGIPVRLYKCLLGAAAFSGRTVTGSMAERMNRDLVVDNSSAGRDLDFDPESFLRYPQRDLPAV